MSRPGGAYEDRESALGSHGLEGPASGLHVAIIMDGNGRWAKAKSMIRVQGHRAGAESVRDVVKAAGEFGVKYLTLYAFSVENWQRPKTEITTLMGLLKSFLRDELPELIKNNVRLQAIGTNASRPRAKTRGSSSSLRSATAAASRSSKRSTPSSAKSSSAISTARRSMSRSSIITSTRATIPIPTSSSAPAAKCA